MDRRHLAALLDTAVTRGTPDRSALLRLATRCWPAASDQRQPVADECVRRWGANRVVVSKPRCNCAAGRCISCN